MYGNEAVQPIAAEIYGLNRFIRPVSQSLTARTLNSLHLMQIISSVAGREAFSSSSWWDADIVGSMSSMSCAVAWVHESCLHGWRRVLFSMDGGLYVSSWMAEGGCRKGWVKIKLQPISIFF